MKKKLIIMQTITTAALSSITAIAYNILYSNAFYVNFQSVIGIVDIIGSCVAVSFLMVFSYQLVIKWNKQRLIPWINLGIFLVSIISTIGVLSYNLPLDLDYPEMFPGLAIPMHFIPALSFYTLIPFFKES